MKTIRKILQGKLYCKEYGWVTPYSIGMWFKWLIFCSGRRHKWLDLGDPCRICGSDNCGICTKCGYHTHD